MQTVISIEGRFELRLNGVLIRQGKNLVTTLGKTLMASVFKNTSDSTRVTHAALGDDASAPEASQTALGNEHAAGWIRAAVTGTNTDNNTRFTATWTATTTETIREAGLFTAAAAGTMVARFLVQEVQINNGDTLDLTWTLNFGGDD